MPGMFAIGRRRDAELLAVAKFQGCAVSDKYIISLVHADAWETMLLASLDKLANNCINNARSVDVSAEFNRNRHKVAELIISP